MQGQPQVYRGGKQYRKIWGIQIVSSSSVRNPSGIYGLAAAVIELAIRDALGLTTTRSRQYQDVSGRYGKVSSALHWIRSTEKGGGEGTFGWWCELAGLNARAVREAVDREVERNAA